MKISLIIPTKDRERDLLSCVESIAGQTLKPHEVLIIDDGNISETTKSKIEKIISGIALRFFKKDKPGLSESKNLGAKEATGDVVEFLDDDIVLKNDHIENLAEIWSRKWDEKNLAGIAGISTNSRKKTFLETVFNIIFCLYSKKSWALLPWGYQTWNSDLKKEELADWVPGHASFRTEIFKKYQFASLQPGRTGAEDIELSWQLKNGGYYFIITPFVHSIHNESPVSRESAFRSGFKDGLNKRVIFNVHSKKNIKNYICFFIASVGWAARQFIVGHYRKGFGMAAGFLHNNNAANSPVRIIYLSLAFVALAIFLAFFDLGLAIGLVLLFILSGLTIFALSKLRIGGKKIYLLFFVVLAIHLLTALFMHYTNFQPFSGGAGDYTFYQQQSQEIAGRLHHWDFSLQGMSIGPVYPVIIGYIYALTGSTSVVVGLLFNVWLVALAIVFSYLIILEIGGEPKNAFIIGIILALYPSYIFNTGLLLKDATEICFTVLSLLFLLKTVKKFKWSSFTVLFLSLICLTNFRFYIGYAVIGTFLLSWFLLSTARPKKRIIIGVLFIVAMGFIPQFGAGRGYYGIDSVRQFLTPQTINFYRQYAYSPLHNVTSIGVDSSFVVYHGPLGYAASFIYVLLGPFPWQIKYTRQSLALFETFPWYFLLVFVAYGIYSAYKKRIKEVIPLLIFSLAALTVIAVFDSNYGLIVRIRISAFIPLLCIASLGFVDNNFIYKYIKGVFSKVLKLKQ